MWLRALNRRHESIFIIISSYHQARLAKCTTDSLMWSECYQMKHAAVRTFSFIVYLRFIVPYNILWNSAVINQKSSFELLTLCCQNRYKLELKQFVVPTCSNFFVFCSFVVYEFPWKILYKNRTLCIAWHPKREKIPARIWGYVTETKNWTIILMHLREGTFTASLQNISISPHSSDRWLQLSHGRT